MLQLRPNCECCDKDLPSEATDARICSYECTFCATCVETVLANVCPNCGDGFTPRPIRPKAERRPGVSSWPLGRKTLLTPSRRRACVQHPCCKFAEHGDKRRVHCNSLTFDRSRRRWQLTIRDSFRSHFRDGPILLQKSLCLGATCEQSVDGRNLDPRRRISWESSSACCLSEEFDFRC
jgi:uncharacterized protein